MRYKVACLSVYHLGLCPPSEHVMDLTTMEGLLDMVALANVLEFTAAMDACYIEPHDNVDMAVVNAQRQEMYTTLSRFREWFSKHHSLKVGDNIEDPCSFLFYPSLHRYA